MSIFDSIGVYDEAEFADNPESRCSIVMILDVSGSMFGDNIDTVNQALVKFSDIIRGDPVTALRADVAIIAFDHEAWVLQDFTNGTDFEAPVLEVHGGTMFSTPINMALDLIEVRKESYRDGGIAYYRSLVYFLTDGMSADTPAQLEQTAQRLAEAEENRSVAFFAFIIGGGDAMVDHLSKLVPRQPIELTNMAQLEGSIVWLSRSAEAVSQSQPGDSLRLPQPDFLDL